MHQQSASSFLHRMQTCTCRKSVSPFFQLCILCRYCRMPLEAATVKVQLLCRFPSAAVSVVAHVQPTTIDKSKSSDSIASVVEMTCIATRRSDVLSITKTPHHDSCGLRVAHAPVNPDGSPGVVVTGVARTGPLAGIIHPGDRILSCNGMPMVAAQLTETITALAQLTLVISPPPEKTAHGTQPMFGRPALGALNR
jgi:hypothetical protein